MFFWGSYNFQVTQQTEHLDRPPVRYPVYLPPTPSLIQAGLSAQIRVKVEEENEHRQAEENTRDVLAPLSTAAAASFIQSSQEEASSHHVRGGALVDDSVANALISLADRRLAVSMVACGAKHMVAVVSGDRTGGEGAAVTECVVGLGSNHSGQLGSAVATYTTSLTDLRVGEVLEGRVVSIACGAKHSLLCTETGCVYVCGDNSVGQLGLPAPLGTKAHAGLNNGAPCSPHFVQLNALVHITKVFANQNASFALDQRGRLYSWGDAQYGHLCHNSRGEALDPDTLKIVTEHVRSPRLVNWFQQQHVRLVDVAVGKSHVVCCSEEDVYTCGDGAYGKLGSGSATLALEPVKVIFPERKQTEKLVSIAAGDDHTLVLKENPVIGSVVYFFGKLSNADGQLTPTIVTIPGAHDVHLSRVMAGKGTLCACLSEDGRLYVWGKHSYPKVYNGTAASASRSTPMPVEVLSGFPLTGFASGGTFCVAFADAKGTRLLEASEDAAAAGHGVKTKEEEVRTAAKVEPAHEEEAAEEATHDADKPTLKSTSPLSTRLHPWDVLVPQDTRVSVHFPDGDVDEEYEQGRAALLTLYLGERLGTAYAATLPPTPPKTLAARYAFTKLGGRGLALGQKVRLWMTDVYALGTVVRVGAAPHPPSSQLLSPSPTSAHGALSRGGSQTGRSTSPVRGASVKREVDSAVNEEDTHSQEDASGTHVRVEWQRDDWDDESLSLFSDDETLDEERDNRWQPFWFEKGVDGNYAVARGHK